MDSRADRHFATWNIFDKSQVCLLTPIFLLQSIVSVIYEKQNNNNHNKTILPPPPPTATTKNKNNYNNNNDNISWHQSFSVTSLRHLASLQKITKTTVITTTTMTTSIGTISTILHLDLLDLFHSYIILLRCIVASRVCISWRHSVAFLTARER